MKFHVRQRRTAPAVIIVALIDVLIVLVIFLLVTTTFKQTPSLQLALPASRQALRPGASDNPPVILTIASNGWFYLNRDTNPVLSWELPSRLQGIATANPKAKLAVRADQNAPWGKIVEAMDAAKAAKLTDISAFTKDARR